jgi:carbonic anhydrase/acetyltransferase-like protein (isoleucine patch superfamily)
MKYKTEKDETTGLLRIISLIDIPSAGVKVGDKGGRIEKESTLSHEGDCWVYENARVYEDALVSGAAQVFGNALVSGNAWVYEDARVSGNAQVFGDARVFGNALVSGDARVFGNAQVSGNAWVYENARVYEDAQVYGNARVLGDAKGEPLTASDVTQSPPSQDQTGEELPAPPSARARDAAEALLMAVAAVEKEMFPPLTVADIQAEFDRVNAGAPCVADKLDTLSKSALGRGYTKHGGRLRVPELDNVDHVDHLNALLHELRLYADGVIPRSGLYLDEATTHNKQDSATAPSGCPVQRRVARPWLVRLAKIKAARPDAETLQFSEQLDGELRTGGINKQVEQLKMHMAAKLDFSPGGPPASSKQVGGTHYKDLAIQPVEYCQRNNLGFCESSVVKYVTRHKAKAGVEDLKKARHFIDLLIEMTEKDVNKKATYCEDARH